MITATNLGASPRCTASSRVPLLAVVATLSMGFAASFLVACNTTKGVGEDVEAAGEGIQNVAEDAKDAIKN
jgi:entericidin B